MHLMSTFMIQILMLVGKAATMMQVLVKVERLITVQPREDLMEDKEDMALIRLFRKIKWKVLSVKTIGQNHITLVMKLDMKDLVEEVEMIRCHQEVLEVALFG